MGATESKNSAPELKGPIILPGDEQIRVSSLLEDPNKLVECEEGTGVNTIPTLFHAGLKNSGHKPCLGTRKSENDDYEWITYAEVNEKAKKIGSALTVKAKDSSYIAIRCKNRPEWTITTIGCSLYSFTICTINFTTDYESVKKIINQASFKVFICASEEDATWILNNHNDVPSIELLVIMDLENEDKLTEMAKAVNVEIFSFSNFLEFGNNNMQELNCAKPDDIFTVCYTSGTTGDPKGVMISHKSLMSCCCALSMSFTMNFEDVTLISYLPVAHIFEVAAELYTLRHSGRIGFYRGDIRGLMNDIEVLKPSFFPVVPRLLNRIYSEVMNQMNESSWKKYLMNWALKSKSDAMKANGGKTIWDSLLFPRIRNKLGGRIEVLLVASAPISSDVKAFFKCALDCYVLEAYGQTETGAVTLTDPNDWKADHVGYPQPNVQMKLIDVPEMNYFAKDNIGEICAKGPSVMVGYFNRNDLTAETKDEEGWVHTGDIGRWLPNGSLQILDRRKNIFKLSQGEYIAPEKIENSYSRCNLISQLFVDGISTENFCVILVVPNTDVFVKWAKSNGIEDEDLESLCENKTVGSLLLGELHKQGKKDGLNSLEQVKRIKILSKPFTCENGLLTATLKNKRPALRKFYEKEIKSLYEAEQ